MQLPEGIIYPIFMPAALREMNTDGLTQRHVTVLALIAKGYITTRMIVFATKELDTPPKHYRDVLDVVQDLVRNNLIHHQEAVTKPYRGRTNGALSLTMNGAAFLSNLHKMTMKMANKHWEAKIPPASLPYG